jgi:hypothetical protein
MAVIRSGASSDELTIDATSKAARSTLYDSQGTELLPPPTGVYCLPFGFRLSAIASGKIWAIRNLGALTVYITRIQMAAAFDGVAAASTVIYNLMRFNLATPTGGTTMTVVKKNNAFPSSVVTSAQFLSSAALTVAGITFEAAFANLCCQHQVNANALLDLTFLEHPSRCFTLAPNEGLAVDLGAASVAGDSLSGIVEWFEI